MSALSYPKLLFLEPTGPLALSQPGSKNAESARLQSENAESAKPRNER
jgi:hypothetical protein